MEFTIVSHAGLLVRGAGVSLLIDPWIVGSCYWRSWWNYPPVPDDLLRSLRPDAIYLTHIHWDHFHGVSLRRFPRETPILVPRGHHDRIPRDLHRLGFRNVREIPHAGSVPLGDDFRITSYQFSPFLDSALVVECAGITLLDANDAKFMGGPLRQILKRHPSIDFLFRSHSSANSRLSYDVIDDPTAPVDDLERYIESFAAFARATGARHAIPFASNHCYLHKDVYSLNGTIQTPRMVETHFRERGLASPQIVIMLAGDSWSTDRGFQLSPTAMDFFDRRDVHLERYRDEKTSVLERFYATEARSRVREQEVRAYFSKFLAAVPRLVRRRFKGRPARFVVSAGDDAQVFEIDVYRRAVSEIPPTAPPAEHPLEIHTTTFVFRQCMALDLFSHLAISKRVRYRVTARTRRTMALLNLLFNLYEYDYLPVRSMLTARFATTWMRRWREMLLYARMGSDRILKGRLSEIDYIERGTVARGAPIDFSNQSPASDR